MCYLLVSRRPFWLIPGLLPPPPFPLEPCSSLKLSLGTCLLPQTGSSATLSSRASSQTPAGPQRTLGSHHARCCPGVKEHVTAVEANTHVHIHWELSLLPGSSALGPGPVPRSHPSLCPLSLPSPAEPISPLSPPPPAQSARRYPSPPQSIYVYRAGESEGVMPRSPGPVQVGPEAASPLLGPVGCL